MSDSRLITLTASDGSRAVIAPDLGGWLLRYSRPTARHGTVDAIHFEQEIVDRYPQGMYAGNPILFPLVSFNHLASQEHHYEWDGRIFEMPQHGFGRRSKWSVTGQSADSVTMELTDSETTRALYPFAFRHQLTYRLIAGRIQWTQEVENRSPDPMPFSTGFHPYFQVPLTSQSRRDACFLRIPEANRLLPKGSYENFDSLPFPDRKFSVSVDTSGTYFLTDLARPEIELVDPVSELSIVLNWADSPHHRFVALWSRTPDSPFYCIEPWTAMPNSFTRRAPGELILLAPGQIFQAGMWLELRG